MRHDSVMRLGTVYAELTFGQRTHATRTARLAGRLWAVHARASADVRELVDRLPVTDPRRLAFLRGVDEILGTCRAYTGPSHQPEEATMILSAEEARRG